MVLGYVVTKEVYVFNPDTYQKKSKTTRFLMHVWKRASNRMPASYISADVLVRRECT